MNDTLAPQGSPPPCARAAAPQAVAVITPPPREVRVVTDPIPTLDTAKFEHMYRVATAMAEMSVLPDSLRLEKDADGNVVLLPFRTIVANCFMVVNQAVRWHMDPFAVVQCCSVVHGRLMYEGKLVAAVLDANLGVRLSYEFNNKTGQNFGVTVSGTIPGEDKPRTIFGRVMDWHRGPKSPWASEGAWERQLRYMGAREWARAHSPATMLGVVAAEEADGIIMNQPRGAGHAELRLVPDIPDIPEAKSDKSPNQIVVSTNDIPGVGLDSGIVDVETYLDKLRSERGYCDDKKDLKELIASNEAAIGTLSAKDQKRARKILAGQE